ncbi:MAG: HRDC domain-containing protein, partial [Planctomycetota bacterium]
RRSGSAISTVDSRSVSAKRKNYPQNMPVHFFSIDARMPDPEAIRQLNQFLASHKTVSVRKELVSDSGHSFWAIAVDFLQDAVPTQERKSGESTRNKSLDYREVLTPAQFAIFARLREARKEIANRDGVPVYTIFTNHQLSEMVTEKIRTMQGFSAIRGVGKSRIEKYGDAMLEILNDHPPEDSDETSQESI